MQKGVAWRFCTHGRPDPEYDMWEEYIEIDATPWGANEAYQLKLRWNWQLTSEQMKTVAIFISV